LNLHIIAHFRLNLNQFFISDIKQLRLLVLSIRVVQSELVISLVAAFKRDLVQSTVPVSVVFSVPFLFFFKLHYELPGLRGEQLRYGVFVLLVSLLLSCRVLFGIVSAGCGVLVSLIYVADIRRGHQFKPDLGHCILVCLMSESGKYWIWGGIALRRFLLVG
jgi:hypothetical protein